MGDGLLNGAVDTASWEQVVVRTATSSDMTGVTTRFPSNNTSHRAKQGLALPAAADSAIPNDRPEVHAGCTMVSGSLSTRS